jgi:hypothetical protein
MQLLGDRFDEAFLPETSRSRRENQPSGESGSATVGEKYPILMSAIIAPAERCL